MFSGVGVDYVRRKDFDKRGERPGGSRLDSQNSSRFPVGAARPTEGQRGNVQGAAVVTRMVSMSFWKLLGAPSRLTALNVLWRAPKAVPNDVTLSGTSRLPS